MNVDQPFQLRENIRQLERKLGIRFRIISKRAAAFQWLNATLWLK